MELVDCYRMLGLRSGATFDDVKSSYRRLAQQYHPDINPDDQKAKDKFIALTEAYKFLLQVIPSTAVSPHVSSTSMSTTTRPVYAVYAPPEPHKPRQQSVQQADPSPQKQTRQTKSNFAANSVNGSVHRQTVKTAPRPQTAPPQADVADKTPPPPAKPPNIREVEMQLKWKTYQQLQQFLRDRRFPQAIALAEALAERLPEDVEVRQWQAISYQLWGRALISEKQWLKARIYLKKALKTDPSNKSLIQQVQLDFQRLEHVF